MHHMKFVLNIRLVALLAVTAAVLLAASSFATTPRQASATYTSPEGVMCFELVAAGTGIGLTRIDDLGGGNITFSSQVYLTGGSGVPTCQQLQNAMPGDAVPVPAADGARTVLAGNWDAGTHTITASSCVTTSDAVPGPPGTWTLINVNFVLDPNPAIKSSGSYETRDDQIPVTCGDTVDTDVLAATVPDSIFIAGAPLGTANTSTNWDKDGLSDWEELDPAQPASRDPFINVGVGGIAELADEAGTPLAAPDSSSSNTGLIAGIVAAIAAGTVALGGAAWYTKRRSIQ